MRSLSLVAYRTNKNCPFLNRQNQTIFAPALADRSPDGVTKHDAKVAVARAHGDDGVSPPEVDEPAPEDEIASPEDAEKVKEERKR